MYITLLLTAAMSVIVMDGGSSLRALTAIRAVWFQVAPSSVLLEKAEPAPTEPANASLVAGEKTTTTLVAPVGLLLAALQVGVLARTSLERLTEFAPACPTRTLASAAAPFTARLQTSVSVLLPLHSRS